MSHAHQSKMDTSTWQHEKQELINSLEHKLTSEATGLCLAQLKNVSMPPILKAALKNRAKQLFRSEKPVQLSLNGRYNLQDPDFQKGLEQSKKFFLEHFQFQRHELAKIIRFTISLALDTSLRPFKIIPSLLFQKSQKRSRSDIVRILQGLAEKGEVAKAVLAGLNEVETEIIEKEAFLHLLQTVRQERYQHNQITPLFAELREIEQLFGFAFDADELSLPAGLFEEMLQDRQLTDLLHAFRQEMNACKSWSLPQFTRFLERYAVVGKLNVVETQESMANFDIDDPAAIQTTRSDDFSTPDDGSSILQMDIKNGKLEIFDFEKAQPPEANAENRQEVPSLLDMRRPDPDQSMADAVSADELPPASPAKQEPTPGSLKDLIIRRENIEKQPPGPYPSLKALIDNKSKKTFIKKLFDNDEAAYVAFVERLEATDTWKEAKVLFDQEMDRRQVNVFSRNAIKLSDLLFSRYFAKNRY